MFRQPAKIEKFNRLPTKIENFNRLPTKLLNFNRQPTSGSPHSDPLVTFEPVDADTVCGDVLRVVFYSWKKFLVSGYESRKSLWLSKMTSVFILTRCFRLKVLTAKNAHKSADIRFLFSICRLCCIPLILEGLAVHMSGVNSVFFNKR